MRTLGSCIMVFGVSGIGKSTITEDFVGRNPNYIYARASALLEVATHAGAESLRKSAKPQIIKNQMLLPAALDRLREGKWERPVILDAHATIDNDSEIVEVPAEVIERLRPTGFVLLDAKPEFILQRRADAQRSRPERSRDQIAVELDRERSAVTAFSERLRLPLQVVILPGSKSLDDAVEALQAPVKDSSNSL